MLDALPSSSSESFTAAATNVAGFKSQLVLASAQLAAIDDNLIDSLNTTFQTIHDFTSSATTIIENVPIADRIAMALFCLDQATMTRSIAVNQSEAEAGTINYGDMMAIDENPFSLSFYSFVDLDIKWCLEGLGILESLTRTQPTASSSSSSSSTSATSPAIGTLELKTQFQIILASKYLEKHKSTTTKNGSRAEELQEEKGCDVDKQGEVTSIMPYLDRSLASIDTALVYAAACRRTTPSSSSSSSKTASKNINNNDGASSTSSLLLALKLKLDIMCCKLDCGGGSDGYSADAAIAPVVTTTTPDNALVDEFTRGVDVLCGGPSSNTATAAPASQIIGRDLDLVVGMVHLIAQRCKE